MTVQELIKKLMVCDPDAQVQCTTTEAKWGKIIDISEPKPPPGTTMKGRNTREVFLTIGW